MDAGGISVAGVGKSFGSVEALTDVSLEVEESTVFGLLGPNSPCRRGKPNATGGLGGSSRRGGCTWSLSTTA